MGRGPKVALVFIGAAFLVCCGGVAWYDAPWEAPDEPEHVQNVQTLLDGRWYRIGEADGIESHQPPLYYLALAGWQKAIDLPARAPRPVAVGFHPCRPNVCPLYEHDLDRDDADARRVRALRVPSVLMGLLTIGLTALAARRLSNDRWTPVVAAALMASVPRFAFVSASVNNDVLVILCGAAMLALLASTVRPERRTGLEDPVGSRPSVVPCWGSRCWPSSTASCSPFRSRSGCGRGSARRSVAGRCAPRHGRRGDRVPGGQRLVAGDEPGALRRSARSGPRACLPPPRDRPGVPAGATGSPASWSSTFPSGSTRRSSTTRRSVASSCRPHGSPRGRPRTEGPGSAER